MYPSLNFRSRILTQQQLSLHIITNHCHSSQLGTFREYRLIPYDDELAFYKRFAVEYNPFRIIFRAFLDPHLIGL